MYSSGRLSVYRKSTMSLTPEQTTLGGRSARRCPVATSEISDQRYETTGCTLGLPTSKLTRVKRARLTSASGQRITRPRPPELVSRNWTRITGLIPTAVDVDVMMTSTTVVVLDSSPRCRSRAAGNTRRNLSTFVVETTVDVVIFNLRWRRTIDVAVTNVTARRMMGRRRHSTVRNRRNRSNSYHSCRCHKCKREMERWWETRLSRCACTEINLI